jgi:hypothetical protein
METDMTFNRYMRGMSNGGRVMARPGEVLDDDALMAVAPSIFATEAHSSRSDRFAAIPTSTVVAGLRNEGVDPFFAQQARSRIVGKSEFTKHMLRLRHRSLANAQGEAFEIILINANDGTSSYQMIPGFFRFVCANGLMVGDTFNAVKVRHSGDAVGNVIEGAYSVLEEAPKVAEAVDRFKSVRLGDPEALLLAQAAHEMRFPNAYLEGEAAVAAPVEASKLLRPRRSADREQDLWTTFNVLQENVVRGGQVGHVRDANNRLRRKSTRAVAGIDQSKALNRALWTLTERMADLKA